MRKKNFLIIIPKERTVKDKTYDTNLSTLHFCNYSSLGMILSKTNSSVLVLQNLARKQ